MLESSEESGSDSGESSKSWSKKDLVQKNSNMDILAARYELDSAKMEIQYLKRRNDDLESLLKEKETLL